MFIEIKRSNKVGTVIGNSYYFEPINRGQDNNEYNS